MQFALRLPHIGLRRGLLVPLRCCFRTLVLRRGLLVPLRCGFRTLVLRRGLLLPLRCGFRTLVLRAAFHCRCAAASPPRCEARLCLAGLLTNKIGGYAPLRNCCMCLILNVRSCVA